MPESATEPGVRLASYVDRIVRGGKPCHSQVQALTKYRLAINFKGRPRSAADLALARAVDTIDGLSTLLRLFTAGFGLSGGAKGRPSRSQAARN